MRNLGVFFIGLVLVLFIVRVGFWPFALVTALLLLGIGFLKAASSSKGKDVGRTSQHVSRSHSVSAPGLPDVYRNREPYVMPKQLRNKLKNKLKQQHQAQ